MPHHSKKNDCVSRLTSHPRTIFKEAFFIFLGRIPSPGLRASKTSRRPIHLMRHGGPQNREHVECRRHFQLLFYRDENPVCGSCREPQHPLQWRHTLQPTQIGKAMIYVFCCLLICSISKCSCILFISFKVRRPSAYARLHTRRIYIFAGSTMR